MFCRHSVKKRMCAVPSHDPGGADDIRLTHELGDNVGAAATFICRGPPLDAGLISYHRGRITVLDRKRLDHVVAKEFGCSLVDAGSLNL